MEYSMEVLLFLFNDIPFQDVREPVSWQIPFFIILVELFPILLSTVLNSDYSSLTGRHSAYIVQSTLRFKRDNGVVMLFPVALMQHWTEQTKPQFEISS